MAHWAEIDSTGLVLRVVYYKEKVIDLKQKEIAEQFGYTYVFEDEPDEGYGWVTETFGGTWVQTSYNKTIRKNFAGIGYRYDETLDAFIPPQPFLSWTLDTETCAWSAPVPYPTDGLTYQWDEPTLEWKLIVLEDTWVPPTEEEENSGS